MPYIAFGKVFGQLKHRHWGYNRISTRIMKVNNKIIFSYVSLPVDVVLLIALALYSEVLLVYRGCVVLGTQ